MCGSSHALDVDESGLVDVQVDFFLQADLFLQADILRCDRVGTCKQTSKRSQCVAQRMRPHGRRRHLLVRRGQSFSGCQLCLRLLSREREGRQPEVPFVNSQLHERIPAILRDVSQALE